MGEYFIPLKTLLPLAGKLPLIHPFADKIGIRDLVESWNDTHITTEGIGVVDGEVVIEVGGFAIVVGNAATVTTFEFITAEERRSIIRTAIEEGMTALVGSASTEEDVDLDPPTKTFLMLDWLSERSRTIVSGAALKLRLPPDHAKLATKVMNGTDVVGLKKIVPDQPVDITIGSLLITYDSIEGLTVSVPADQVFEVPPFFIADSDIGMLVHDLKVDFSVDTGIAEVLSRPGYDETWKGVYIGELSIYGLNELLPFLPSQLEATKWICGTEGWSGAVDMSVFPAADPKDFWQLTKLGIEFDRGALVRGTIGAQFRVGSFDTSLLTLGPDGILEIVFTLRHNPALTGTAAWGFDIALLTPSTKDKGLLTIEKDLLLVLEMALPILVLTALDLASGIDGSSAMVVLLFSVISALQALGVMVLERVRLDALRFRFFSASIAGEVVRFIDVVMDFQTKLSLDINIPFILTAKTSRPIGVDLKGLTLRWALKWDSLQPATRTELGSQFEFLFEIEGGVTFDLSEQSIISDSVLEIVKFGAGKWELGLWFDVGVRTTQKLTNAGAGGAAVRLYYLADGTFDHAALAGLSLTIFVPEVILIHADLGWGDVKFIYTDAMFVGNGTASLAPPPDPKDPLGALRPYMKRSAWNWSAEVLVQWQEFDGVTSLVAGIELTINTGIPLGTSGVSIFGFLGQYANNAAPEPKVTGSGNWLKWFTDAPKKNSVLGPPPKWMAKKDDWGLGLGAVIGSTPLGRVWNAKVGVTVLFPGPVIVIYGAANILKPKPAIGDTEGANFVAIIVLDFEEGTLTVGITVKYSMPDDGKLLTLTVPTEIFVNFGGGDGWFHLYLGKHMPLSERITAKALGLFDISGYLMFDTKAIENLAGRPEVDIPPFAIALGGRAEWVKGLKSGKLKCYFHLGVEFNLAIGMPDPWLFYGMVRLDGGLVVKVFGFGFEFGVWAELEAWAPEPFRIKGSVGISIDLPWPIPNINASVPFTLADEGENLPAPGSSMDALTVHHALLNKPFNPEEPAEDGQPRFVPIDAILSMAFRFPIRTDPGAIGSLSSVVEPDGQVTFITAAGQGYIFQLKDLQLTNVDTGVAMTNIPARWRVETAKAPGNQPSRVSLDLFAFKSDPTSRYIGASAGYLDASLSEWTPCKPVKKATQVCYDFLKEKTGPIGKRTIDASNHPSLTVTTAPPPANAEFLKAIFQLVGTQSEIVDVANLRLACIPGTFGSVVKTLPALEVSEALVLQFDRARDIAVHAIQPSQRSAIFVVRFYDGEKLVHTTSAGTPEDSGLPPEQIPYTGVLFAYPGPATHVSIVCFRESVTSEGGILSASSFAHDVYLRRLCVTYESEIIEAEQAAASNSEWSSFWSDLLAQDAAASDALLLDPESHYALTSTVHWTYLDGSGGGDETRTYNFETEPKNREIRKLRKRNPQLEKGDDKWEVEALPSDGTYAMYTTRPIRLTFSDPRIEAVFAKFDQKLVLRLIDDHGIDLFDALEILKTTATELPEYEQSWMEKVTGAPCTPAGVESLWSWGAANFDTILVPNREYTAALHAVPAALSDFANAAWAALPSVLDFKFRTSRWKNATEHALAHVLRDEILDAPPDLASASAHAGAATGNVVGDQLLDTILFDDVKLPFRTPAAVPEVVTIWQKNGDAYAAVGLLFDGPEPLVREAGSSIELAHDGIPLAHLSVAGSSGARSLLLFTAPPAPGTLAVKITDAFTDSSGSAQTETATISVPLAALPAVLAEEVAP